MLAIRLWKRSRKWALAFLIFHPAVLFSSIAVCSYFAGTASLHFRGLPGTQSFNIDRTTRLPRQGGGCVINGSEWLPLGSNNLTLVAMTKAFGPMKGSLDGPYPSDEELLADWPGAREVPFEEIVDGRLQLSDRLVEVPFLREIAERIDPRHFFEEMAASELPPILAKEFGGDSFAVRFPVEDSEGEHSFAVVLLSGSPVRVMGYFTPRGTHLRNRILPVRPGTAKFR